MASVGNNDHVVQIERPKPLAIPIGYTKAFQVTASALGSQPKSVTEHPGEHWDQGEHAVGGFAGVAARWRGSRRAHTVVSESTTTSYKRRRGRNAQISIHGVLLVEMAATAIVMT
jgi:hypothetical protein